MELEEFTKNFTDQLEDIDFASIKPGTRFREIEGWSSLTALYIIGMVDEKYQIKIKGDDIRQSSTIEDLYKIVKSKS
jgi:acyl carrier protein